MIFALVFLANFLNFVASDGYICAGNHLINPPQDINEAYYWPETWNDGQEPPVYNASQLCNWQINVLDGMYATVFFHKYNKRSDSGVDCTYPNGNTDSILDNDTSPYIFTSPQFQINLNAKDTEGQFAFKVIWSYYPAQICKNEIPLSGSELIPSVGNDCTTTFTSDHRVLLVGFALADMLRKNLRLSAVYEGDSINGKYLGNLLDAYNNNIKSEGTQLTVYTFGLLSQSNHTLFLGMDVQAAGDITHFTGLDCSDWSQRCIIQLSSPNGATAVITASRKVDYLKLPTAIPTNGNLRIYEGSINDDHLLATVNKDNVFSMFPMAVKNTVKIYTLDQGTENIQVFNKAEDAAYSHVYVGRYVNIHSFDVDQITYYQDTLEKFSTGNSKDLVNFNFDVSYFNVNGPTTTLEITVTCNGNTVFYEKYFGGNYPPPTMFMVVGDSMTVNYQTNGIYTRGFRLGLWCEPNDETSTVTPLTTRLTSAPPFRLTPTLPTVTPGGTTTQRQLSSTFSMSTRLSTTVSETTTKLSPSRLLNYFCLLVVFIMLLC